MIEHVTPEIDGGQFPAKRAVGDTVVVEADVFAEGHDRLGAAILHRRQGEEHWHEAPMQPLVNDRWRGEFTVGELGRYEFTVAGWVDRFGTWRHALEKKAEAGQDVHVELLEGAELVQAAAARAAGNDPDVEHLLQWASVLADEERDPARRTAAALSEALGVLMERYPDRETGTRHPRTLEVLVDPPRARFSSWYELFPRSVGNGTLRDVEARLDDVAAMGFDVLYLPPVHPIGRSFRKGPNNATEAGPGDPGSPWAIGSEEGGHKDVHPDLGTLDDFRRLVASAAERGIAVALDIAFQCSPDHPWVKEHPEWFKWRPDGTVQYAENPPKKYQDIYPLDFECAAWRELWAELKSVFEHWIAQGVRVFRVDNPHTKPFAFWEWCLGELKRDHPETIYLSEAFTRPKVMHRLAKAGFTQSYTYFAWRNTKWELTEYFTELHQGPGREYFRPNAWPNTPDILTEYLQVGGRPAFVTRLVLAATLSANYGIYGPAFELLDARPRQPGSEEYLDSEKYQIRRWDDEERPDHIRELVALVNRIRHEHPALQSDWSLRFHPTDNEQLICYSKEQGDDMVVVVANLDPHHTQSGWVHLPLEGSYQMHDLFGGGRYLWHGADNYVELNPHVVPAHVFVVRRHVRTEADFDYYL